MRLTLSILAVLTPLAAQQTVAPTPGAVGKTRGQDVEGYNVVQSFETGYRFSSVGGDLGSYRSDVNLRNGIRLLGSSLTVHSKNGQGRFFDELVLYTQGLGNDPYESSTLRVQKNKLYRYDMLWRMNEYFNPGLTIADGSHLLDTRRRLQDHDFTLLPQSKFNFRVGYTRNSQDGPALTTVNLFDGTRGDEFTPFANVRRLRNEFRVGGDVELLGAKLSWMRVWDNFREDTPYQLGASPGANGADRTTLTGFRRGEPYHGNSPLWRGNLRKEGRSWAANARLTYAGGRRNFTVDELALGATRFAPAANRQILVTGNARRPVTAGDFSLSFFPGTRLIVTSNTSVHSTRIDGDSVYREVDNGQRFDDTLYFRYLGIRTVTESTDATYRVSPALSFNGGYHFSARRIRSVENYAVPPFASGSDKAEQDNSVHSGIFGVRFKPAKPVTLALDGEIARASRPFTPISEKNFHTLGARAQYKAKTLLIAAAYRQNYNFNSVSLTAHSARGRNYNLNAAWTPKDWFAIDASYAKMHLDTVSGLAFFAAGQLLDRERSIYVSNIHSANLGVRYVFRKVADLYAGYSVNRDAGDGRASPVTARNASLPVAVLLDPVQTFPLRFESPLARLSVRLHQRLRWNLGWQFYHYNEDFRLRQPYPGYQAHTGYSSLLWAF